MFRSSSIIRELALNLVKVIFMLKHSVKLVVIYYELLLIEKTLKFTLKYK